MLAFGEGAHVEWVGSRLAAPGPGRYARPYGTGTPGWYLWGEVVKQMRCGGVKVRWENGRVTIERPSNLAVQIPMAVA